MFTEDILKQYKALCRPYPGDDDLKRHYFSHLEWKNFKTTIRENIQIEKINKIKDFDHQLRLPFLALSPLKSLASDFRVVDILYPSPRTTRQGGKSNKAKNNRSRICEIAKNDSGLASPCSDPSLEKKMNSMKVYNQNKRFEFGMIDSSQLAKKELQTAHDLELMKYIIPNHKMKANAKVVDLSYRNQKVNDANEFKIGKKSNFYIEGLTNRTYLSTEDNSCMSKDKSRRPLITPIVDVETPYNEFQKIFDTHVKRIFSNIDTTPKASKLPSIKSYRTKNLNDAEFN